jgi:hypothetical protein
MTGHRPRSHSARPVSLAERLEQIFLCCAGKYPRTLKTGLLEKAGRETAWTLDTLDQDMYLCHTEEEVGGIGGREVRV